METIKLKNYVNGTKFKDYLNPDAPEFNITNQTCYFLGENMISPESAKARGFDIDEKFILPPDVNDRIRVSAYVQDVLGIDRQRHKDLYYKTWKALIEGLDHGRLEIGKNENNNSRR
jgi:hypothetical protein